MKKASLLLRLPSLLLLSLYITTQCAAQTPLSDKDLKNKVAIETKILQLREELHNAEELLLTAEQNKDRDATIKRKYVVKNLEKEIKKAEKELKKEIKNLEKLQQKRADNAQKEIDEKIRAAEEKEQSKLAKQEEKKRKEEQKQREKEAKQNKKRLQNEMKQEEKRLKEEQKQKEKEAQRELEKGIPLISDTLKSKHRIIEDPKDPKTWQWKKNEATRFSIRGDFDGDGFHENFYESATSLFSDNPEISQINLNGDLGVYYLANEGDLDGDGGDEISFMTVYRDFSNINTFHVYTYTGNIWKELIQVKGHEWDCPNFQPRTATERFTHEWKRKNQYKTDRIVLKQENGIVDMINIGPTGRYTIEHIKIINKKIAKRHWGEIIQPRHD